MDPRVERIMTAAEHIAAKLDGKKPFAGIVLGVIFGILGVIIVKHAWDAVANKIAAKKAQGEK